MIEKAAASAGGTATEAQLEAINRFAKTPLSAEEVYVFQVRLCDDQPDRDGEKFAAEALPELARLFVGKTGVMDHTWSADRQLARIFETEVVREDGVSFIRAWAYMLKNEKTAGVIAEIEGGIKKEVSVGCSMGRAVCSICGADAGTCEHRKGEQYGNEICYTVLTDPLDAYEFSFVAVPAQPEAGVLKEYGGMKGEKAWKAMETDAALGRQYREALRKDVVRLGLVLDCGLDADALAFVAKTLDDGRLRRVRTAMERRANASYPALTQLPRARREEEKPVEEEFLI